MKAILVLRKGGMLQTNIDGDVTSLGIRMTAGGYIVGCDNTRDVIVNAADLTTIILLKETNGTRGNSTKIEPSTN